MSDEKQDMGTLEKMVNKTVVEGLKEAIRARLTNSYGNSPINAMVDSVVTSRSESIRKLLEESIDEALTGDFRVELGLAARHWLAKVLIAKYNGTIEKKVSELRSSPEFMARVTLAIEKTIKEIKV